MKNKSFLFIGIYFFLTNCSSKLLSPLKGGTDYSTLFKDTSNKPLHVEIPSTTYLIPGNNLKVRAIENCEIKAIQGQCAPLMVFASGKIYAGYGNLKNCFVKKGDKVKRGQIIGELFEKDSIGDNSLAIVLIKNDQFIFQKW